MSEAKGLVETELLTLAGVDTLPEAFAKLALSGRPHDASIFPIKEWHRSGSETYLMEFQILDQDHYVDKHLVMKACVNIDIGGSRLNSWINRRKTFEKNGLKTPTLYAWGGGVVLEEFIPYPAVNSPSLLNQDRAAFLEELGFCYGRLAKIGFYPVAVLFNLRSRGSDVVNIDFGNDMGRWQGEQTDLRKIMFKEVNIELPAVSQKDRRELIAGYSRGLC